MDWFGVFIGALLGFLLGMCAMGVVLTNDFQKQTVGRGFASYDKDGKWDWNDE